MKRWRNESDSACCRVLQQSSISYRNSNNYKQTPNVVGLCPSLSAPFSSFLTICSSGTSFYWPDLPVSSTLLPSSWQPRQKIQEIQRKRMVWQVVDPNHLAVYYYYYRFLSRLRWILHNSWWSPGKEDVWFLSISDAWSSRARGMTLNHLAVRHPFQQRSDANQHGMLRAHGLQGQKRPETKSPKMSSSILS